MSSDATIQPIIVKSGAPATKRDNTAIQYAPVTHTVDDVIDSWHSGRAHEREAMIAKSASYLNAIKATEEQRKQNLRSTIQSILDVVDERYGGEGQVIQRVLLGIDRSPVFQVLYFVSRSMFYSDGIDELMGIVDTFCDAAEEDFSIKIERHFTVEAGKPDTWALVSEGYTRYMVYGLGMS